jgi:tRNA-splicing ligase RtcB
MSAEQHVWTDEPLAPDVRHALDRLRRADDVTHIAVMPDVHLSKEVCVGVALATRNTLVPAAVGGDIGCGMTAIAFDASASLLASAPHAAKLLQALYGAIPISRHRRREARPLPHALARPLSTPALEAIKRREAALQLGTLGRGNHFVEFQADEDNRLWLMAHSGSRGLGQAIRAAHERHGTRNNVGLQVLDADSEQGSAYRSDVEWALTFADINRRSLVDAAAEAMRTLFGVEACEDTRRTCHHNFVRRERHAGGEVWVHRKGAISARDGEPGIIPGSMGAPSHHVVGRGHGASLCSSSHGAGRCMSRGAAAQAVDTARLHRSMRGVWFDHRRADRLLDEAPDAYKDIGRVMKAQRDLTRSVRTLLPKLAFKGT